jgi:hypothetical protein
MHRVMSVLTSQMPSALDRSEAPVGDWSSEISKLRPPLQNLRRMNAEHAYQANLWRPPSMSNIQRSQYEEQIQVQKLAKLFTRNAIAQPIPVVAVGPQTPSMPV